MTLSKAVEHLRADFVEYGQEPPGGAALRVAVIVALGRALPHWALELMEKDPELEGILQDLIQLQGGQLVVVWPLGVLTPKLEDTRPLRVVTPRTRLGPAT